MLLTEVERLITSPNLAKFSDYKLSYMILKPNAARHYSAIIDEIESNQFTIVGQYAILDYETTNMALHMGQENAMKYILPISRMYYDLHGNYGVLVLLAKKDITYENFTVQVVRLKKHIRSQFKLSYLSYVFDTSELGVPNEHQRLVLQSQNGDTLKKDEMNHEGTFMVFAMNEIHSPDDSIEDTVSELKLLSSMGLLSEDNMIPKAITTLMKRYLSFEFLKDMQ